MFAWFRICLVAACAASAAWAGSAAAQPPTPTPAAAEREDLVPLKAQETCPVTGRKINRAYFADTLGYRVYAADAASAAKIQSAPQAAVRTLLLRGEAPEPIAVANPQTQCPIMDDPINKNRYADVNGYRVYVCCRACIPEVRADPEKAITKIRAAGETPEPRPILEVQSVCAFDGNPIRQDMAVKTADGRTLFACSTPCALKVKENPEKALEGLLTYGQAPMPPKTK